MHLRPRIAVGSYVRTDGGLSWIVRRKLGPDAWLCERGNGAAHEVEDFPGHMLSRVTDETETGRHSDAQRARWGTG